LTPRIRPRAARDTCAPRAIIRRLINRNQLTMQCLGFCPARGAPPSRDTSAALQLSSEFSYLPASIDSSPFERVARQPRASSIDLTASALFAISTSISRRNLQQVVYQIHSKHAELLGVGFPVARAR